MGCQLCVIQVADGLQMHSSQWSNHFIFSRHVCILMTSLTKGAVEKSAVVCAVLHTLVRRPCNAARLVTASLS